MWTRPSRRAAGAAALACGLAAAVALPGAGHGQAELSVTSDLAVPASATFMGAADGQILGHDPEGRQFFRIGGSGWSTLGPALRRDGTPFPTRIYDLGTGVGHGTSSVSAGGGFALVAQQDPDHGGPFVLLAHDRGGSDVRELPRPVAGDPADPSSPSLLHADEDLGRSYPGTTALAAVDDGGGKTGMLLAPMPGSDSASIDRVLRYDGASGRWSEEPIEGAPGRVSPLALSARSGDDAWLLANGPNAVPLLFRRDAAAAKWRQVALSGPLATPPSGVAIAPKSYPADALTAADGGAWLDVDVTGADGGGTKTAALFVDTSGAIAGSWCDATAGGAPLCADRLGVEFGDDPGICCSPRGYRSIALPGPGRFGARIVSNGGDSRYVRFDGAHFTSLPTNGESTQDSAAFTSLDQGYLGGPIASRVSRTPPPAPPAAVPLPVRRPLLAAAPEPGKPVGDPGSRALAVGAAGTVLRYQPGSGWLPEFLVNPGTAERATPTLRGVAWPAGDFAIAVGDRGTVYSWSASRGTWEPDESRPDDLTANLTGVAFQPGNPDRGYVIGRQGTLLRYDKTLVPDALPDAVAGADMISIGFAGATAMVVAHRQPATTNQAATATSALLVDDGSGWRVDEQLGALLAQRPGAVLTTVAGLPDGGAVAAGRNFVATRDGAGQPWVADPVPPTSAQYTGRIPVAAAALREGGRVRALLSITQHFNYPAPRTRDSTAPPSPDVPTPPRSEYGVADDAALLRSTAQGWRDEQHAFFNSMSGGAPLVPDPILSLALVGPGGNGWLLGGTEPVGIPGRQYAETAAAYRYPAGAPLPATGGAETSVVPLAAGPARFLVAGGADCLPGCADHPEAGFSGEVMLAAAIRQGQALAARPNGPRALLYTGSRMAPGRIGPDGVYPPRGVNGGVPVITRPELDHYAAQTQSAAGLPIFVAATPGELLGGSFDAFSSAFASHPAPQGDGSPPPGIAPVAASGSGGRTHFAFDSSGPGGAVRVAFVDLSGSSLSGSDALQHPAEAQGPWIDGVLADAKSRGIPVIVVGTAPLTPFVEGDHSHDPQVVVGNDELERFAKRLVDGGASAYFYQGWKQNRRIEVPEGGAQTIPSWGAGSLNYGYDAGEARTGVRLDDTGQLLVEVDASKRDPATNRAPVSARLVPTIDDLAVDALDGTAVRRGRTALFAGLARRPRAGHPTDGSFQLDPYLSIPSRERCPGTSGCSTRVAPEYRFTSSDPDIGDFVARDANSSDPRSVLLGADGKPVHDPTSGLFCAFNAGTTTVRLEAGGLAYSLPVKVGGGAPQRPCGTVPLAAARFPKPPAITIVAPSASAPGAAPGPASPPPGGGPPPGNGPASVPVPAPAPAPAPPPAHAAAPAPPPPAAPPAPLPLAVAPPLRVPAAVPPPPPSSARPAPPSGTAPVQVSAFANVPAAREQRDEEAAPEDVQAASAYRPGEAPPIVPLTLGVVLVAAAAGVGVRRGSGGRPAPVQLQTYRNR